MKEDNILLKFQPSDYFENTKLWSQCPHGQRVGGQLNVHACPLGVGGWSKRGTNMSTWLLNGPQREQENEDDKTTGASDYP